MAKRKVRTRGPQTLATEAQYLLNQRRVTLWIPFLEAKIADFRPASRRRRPPANRRTRLSTASQL